MILLIDNYDSFTYNLYQYTSELTGEEVRVIRNDAAAVSEILEMGYSRLIISPGPGRPENAGVCVELVKREHNKPVLGVCLGHQAICLAYDFGITYAKKLFHGKKSSVDIISDSQIFKGLGKKIEVGRYHSLAADSSCFSAHLLVTSQTEDGEIMSVQHKEHNIFGIQFHPESILTDCGKTILKNFLEVQ